MKNLLTATTFAALLLGSASAAQAQVSFEIQIGTPPPPPRVYRVRPMPGPEFVWVEGYWYPQGKSGKYRWHDGYWTRAPYPSAYWVEPYWWRGRYYAGYWASPRGRVVAHDHRWDGRRERDEDRGRRYSDDD